MARGKKESKKHNIPFQKDLWDAANKLRKNIDAAEYKHIVLGLIFLKYISDAFEELHAKLAEGAGDYEFADPEDRNEYTAQNVFFVPPQARWAFLKERAKQSDIGPIIDNAMDAIEQENPVLKGMLPKVYGKDNLDTECLGGLIDNFSNIALDAAKERSADVLGHVFEYFLGEFALAEGKKGGQFYTPRSIVELLVAMLEPYKGRVMDPCCGSGGMFVQSELFVTQHQGRIKDLTLFGQESNQTTWRLCKMNLAIRNINSEHVHFNKEGSFLNDAHKDVRVEFILANPPFNDKDWSGELLADDVRWQYGAPPPSNANYAWLQHFVFHLAPNGRAGIVLAKGALTSKTNGEGEIRRRMIEDGNLVDCIVNLPPKLFLNTQIPAALWFLDKSRNESEHRRGEILFIDARNLGALINRKNRVFRPEDIAQITNAYHTWRDPKGNYEDAAGFCASAPLARVADLGFVLTPGRYVGLPDEEDDFNFAERFAQLRQELDAQLEEEKRLNAKITKGLNTILC